MSEIATKATKLTSRHSALERNANDNGKVLFTTYETHRVRHGPAAVKNWALGNGEEHVEQLFNALERGKAEPFQVWPVTLRGKFAFVICGEANRVGNHRTQLNCTVGSLHTSFHLLATGTPVLGDPKSVTGLLERSSAKSAWQRS